MHELQLDSALPGAFVAATARPLLRVEAVESMSALRALQPEWEGLLRINGSDSPFFTFEWIDSWWNHLRQDARAARDELQVRVVRGRSGELAAVAPLVRTERPSTGPLRVRYLDYIGADPNITEIRGMLAHPGYAHTAQSALVEELERSRDWDWIRWNGLTEDALAALYGRLSPASQESLECFILDLPPTWEEFRAGLKRNIRESLRKCYNSLKRDGHLFEFQVAETPTDVAAAVERFFPLHAARAQKQDGTQHRNVFDTPASQEFLREVTTRLAQRRRVRVFEIRVGEQVVATRIGFLNRRGLYLYYSGYNPDWGQYSIMTTVVAEAIQYAIRHGMETVNLSTGRDVSKTRWSPRVHYFHGGMQVASSPRSRVVYTAYQQAYRFRECRMVQALKRRPLATP